MTQRPETHLHGGRRSHKAGSAVARRTCSRNQTPTTYNLGRRMRLLGYGQEGCGACCSTSLSNLSAWRTHSSNTASHLCGRLDTRRCTKYTAEHARASTPTHNCFEKGALRRHLGRRGRKVDLGLVVRLSLAHLTPAQNCRWFFGKKKNLRFFF